MMLEKYIILMPLDFMLMDSGSSNVFQQYIIKQDLQVLMDDISTKYESLMTFPIPNNGILLNIECLQIFLALYKAWF